MKAINFSKKLVLNKKTVSNLGGKELIDAKGGATAAACDTVPPLQCRTVWNRTCDC